MLGNETHGCNIMLCMAPRSLLKKYLESSSYVVMPCCIYTYRAYCVYVIEMLWYVWDPTPSCLFLVAFLMGKCLLVLPSGTHGLIGMCPSLLLCLSLRGNVTRCLPES